MLIAGLDLAAESKGSALAVLDWAQNRVKLVSLKVSVSDNSVVELAPNSAKLGIDCALGWPIDFVDFVKSYSNVNLAGLAFDGGIDWRRNLAYRETDREVHRVTGRWPLSVSTDRLGMTAMRCAGLLSKLQEAGEQIDRSGRGKVVEVYPAGSMRIWGLNAAGYRSSPEARKELIAQLRVAAPWLDLTGFETLMAQSCDAFDAVIAALAAGSAALGLSTAAPETLLKQAQIEGWLALPQSTLAELGQTAPSSPYLSGTNPSATKSSATKSSDRGGTA